HRALPRRDARADAPAGAYARTSPRRRAARPRWRRAARARALVSPRGAGRDRATRRRRDGGARRRARCDHDSRPAHALGIVFVERCAELQLAAAARPGRGARLRRLARGLPPGGHGSLAAVLAVARAPRPGLSLTAALAGVQRCDAGPVSARVAVVGHVEWGE